MWVRTRRTANGFPVGELCVIDRLPRAFGAEDRRQLERLSEIVIRLLGLRIKPEQDGTPAPGTTRWAGLYDQIEASVNRLGTLAGLTKWEDSASTDAAVAYRQSTQEEIGRVLDALHGQITARLQ